MTLSDITDAQWLSLDDHVISRMVKRDVATVRKHRKKLGHPVVRKKGSGRKPSFDYRRFKLNLTDKENAAKLGISVQRAWQIRKQLNSAQEDWV